jgi:hypothetical protein
MGVDEILALAEEVAGLANSLIAAHKAGNQADFNTAWVAMQSKLTAANAAWVAAGSPTVQLP